MRKKVKRGLPKVIFLIQWEMKKERDSLISFLKGREPIEIIFCWRWIIKHWKGLKLNYKCIF